ncbi:MAG: hypothetical protein M3068_05130 [Gemmatimonadota bacterium]|nr:hypothetical protein [Gemmatimonadota bacterium]
MSRLMLIPGLLVVFWSSLAPRARAQSGRYAPLVLQLSASTRALGMGNTWVAGRDQDVIFYNPSQLGVGPGLGVSLERYRSGSTLGTMSASTPLGGGAIGIGIQMLDYGSATPFPPPISALASDDSERSSSTAASVGLSTIVHDLRVGIAGKYAEERSSQTRVGRAAVDLGLAQDVWGGTVGLAVQNIGPRLRLGARKVPFPLRTTLGFSRGVLPLGPFDVALSSAISVLRDGRVNPAGGLELSYVPLDGWVVAGRLGARRTETSGESPLTAGASLGLDRLVVDYAWERIAAGAGAHRVGVRIR